MTDESMDSRELPFEETLTEEGLQAVLNRGPSAPTSEAKPSPPPPPSEVPSREEKPAEGGLEAGLRESTVLPSEAEKAMLKQRYGEGLYVVPVPFLRDDGKAQGYVVRPLTRGQWRALEDQARKTAEAKGDVDPDYIFQEKVVAQAVVWPKGVEEHTMMAQPAGLIPTLFDIVRQKSLFLNPDVLMSYTFPL